MVSNVEHLSRWINQGEKSAIFVNIPFLEHARKANFCHASFHLEKISNVYTETINPL